VRRAALLVAILALPALAGCRYGQVVKGDDQFLRAEVELVAGETTAADVAEALGPPDSMWTEGERLWFHYAYEDAVIRVITIRYYGGKWFQSQSATAVERDLVVVFDAGDRLLYHATSDPAGDQPGLLNFSR